MRLIALAALTVLSPVLCHVAFGGPSAEEKRAEAHRTVLRRFSEQAGTKEIGLSPSATALVDLFLDMQRNLLAVRNRTAPRSSMFMGNAHPQIEVEDGKLRYQAAFVNFVIDEVTVPLGEVPSVVAAASDEEKFAFARIESDAAKGFLAWRWQLVSVLAGSCDEALRGTSEAREAWDELRPRLGSQLVKALDSIDPRDAFPLLNTLRIVGGEDAAKSLISKIEALPEGAPPFVRPMFVRAACGMDCNSSRQYLCKMLEDESPHLVAAALDGLRSEPDDDTWARLEKIVRSEPIPDPAVWHGALRALERIGNDRASVILKFVFTTTKYGDLKLAGALALLRLGDDDPIEWLEEKLVEFKARTDPRSRWAVSAIEKALKDRRERK